ncbi:MAG: hexokinase [Sphaerochaetaceae bacterium]|nr:hexokinase [Sphaerochaetaceae bacterium]NLV83098.1 hexokinase [Spirochaetales bacterium]
MDAIVRKTDAFLHKWNVTPDAVDMQACCNLFLSEMEQGLHGKKSSLAMIPTYTSTDFVIQPNKSVIVLDAGGTNFRTCLVRFDEQCLPHIDSFKKSAMPGSKSEVSAKEFFAILADNVEPFIDQSDAIGFCFSYAAAITADHDGIPLVFSKEVKAPEVVGMPVGKSLMEELSRRAYRVADKKVAVVNDTVATLLAGKAASGSASYDGYVGFILGTGTNTAYVEQNSNIHKNGIASTGSQIINVESGNLDLVLGDLDKIFFDSTKQPDSYHFEKIISGAYLGGFSQLVINQAIEEGLFSSEFSRLFSLIEPLNTTRMSHYLEMPFNTHYDLVKCIATEDDGIALYMIIDSIIARAAKLTAVNLSAAVLKSGEGENPRYPVCINADGTTYYKTENLRRYTQHYVVEFMQRTHHRYARFVHVDDSPILGAAVAALSLM